MWSSIKRNSNIIDVGSLLLILIMSVLMIIKYPNLPDQVPQRFSIDGRITGYGGKLGVFSLPLLALLSMLVLYVAAHFQKLWGISEVQKEFQEEVFLKVRLSFSLMRLELTMMIFLVAMCSMYQSEIPLSLILLLGILFLVNTAYSFHITKYSRRHAEET